MRERLLVADSGPLIALAGISHLHLLPQLYSRIAAPLAVIAEIRAGEHLSPGHCFLDDIPWLEYIESPQLPESLSIVLGRGEAETITLARLHADSLLLLDDHQARRAAEALGLSITGHLSEERRNASVSHKIRLSDRSGERSRSSFLNKSPKIASRRTVRATRIKCRDGSWLQVF